MATRFAHGYHVLFCLKNCTRDYSKIDMIGFDNLEKEGDLLLLEADDVGLEEDECVFLNKIMLTSSFHFNAVGLLI